MRLDLYIAVGRRGSTATTCDNGFLRFSLSLSLRAYDLFRSLTVAARASD